MSDPQPMQPVTRDEDGTLRFRGNAIVRHLLDLARTHKLTDLNGLAERDFAGEDWEQFMQLLGYTIKGYHELSFVSDESAERASELARAVDPTQRPGCRDEGCAVHGGPLFDRKGERTP